MTFKARFLWKKGDLTFKNPCRPPTKEELERADHAIDEIAADLAEYKRSKRH